MNNVPEFKKTPLAKSIKGMAYGDMVVDTSGDEDFLQGESYSWDELNTLKEELAGSIMDFIGQVRSAVENPHVLNNLGDHKNVFNATIDIFFKDISNFSLKVKENRNLHEHLSGKITDLSQLGLYNHCAMAYHSMFSELQALVGPSLSKIMTILVDIMDTSKESQQQVTEEVNSFQETQNAKQ